MTETVKVMLVDDHVLVRQALQNMLEAEGTMRVADQASSWQQAADRQEKAPCDVILMDIELEAGSGVDGIRHMRSRWPELAILAFSGHADGDTVVAALEAGASGFVPKSAPREDLALAFRVVLEGGCYLDPHLTRLVVDRLRMRSNGADHRQLTLCAREREIIELVAQGLGNRDIADRLFLTETTVKSYLRTLYRRLSVSDRAQAVACVIRAGLISIPDPP